MVKQKCAKITTEPPVLIVEPEMEDKDDQELDSAIHSRFLGINLNHDLSWRSHLELGEKPLLPALRSRLGGLEHLGSIIPQTGRRILGNGLILSKISYMLPVWGGTQCTHEEGAEDFKQY